MVGKTIAEADRSSEKVCDRWEKWAEHREVSPWGCCNVYKAAARRIEGLQDIKNLLGAVTSDPTSTFSMKVRLSIPKTLARKMRKTCAKRKAK